MPYLVLLTITRKLVIQIDASHHFRLLITLCKNNSYMLLIIRNAFQCIGWTRHIIHIAFFIIDFPVSYNFFHFFLGDMPALHSTFCMPGVFQIGNAPVETTVSVNNRFIRFRFFTLFILVIKAIPVPEPNGHNGQ